MVETLTELATSYWWTLLPLIGIPVFYVVRLLPGNSKDRQRKAVEAAGTLRLHGLTKVADVVTEVAIGNIKGIVVALYHLVDEYNDGSIDQELQEVFDKMLEAHAKDPALRAKLKASYDELMARYDVKVVDEGSAK